MRGADGSTRLAMRKEMCSDLSSISIMSDFSQAPGGSPTSSVSRSPSRNGRRRRAIKAITFLSPSVGRHVAVLGPARQHGLISTGSDSCRSLCYAPHSGKTAFGRVHIAACGRRIRTMPGLSPAGRREGQSIGALPPEARRFSSVWDQPQRCAWRSLKLRSTP
ncbi:hypothetical protein D9M68_832980 [compost metagenome]